MSATLIHKYKDRWVLTSAKRVNGGGTLDAEPVRIVEALDVDALARVVREVLAEDQPVVSSPDWNDPRLAVGIRAIAVGARSWRTFAKDARAFNLEERNDGLLLEEWPRKGYSFTAKPIWQKKFAPGSFDALARFLVDLSADAPLG